MRKYSGFRSTDVFWIIPDSITQRHSRFRSTGIIQWLCYGVLVAVPEYSTDGAACNFSHTMDFSL
jgi:hypothetical protein